MNKADNGWSNLPAMAPRPFKYCPGCRVPLAGGETKCNVCSQLDKGVPADADIKPFTDTSN